jgi:hypothetical protein
VLEKLREKEGTRVLLDTPERGEKVRRFEREGGKLDRVVIGDAQRQHLRAPASDLGSPVASFRRVKGGARGGVRGLYRGGLGGQLRRQ